MKRKLTAVLSLATLLAITPVSSGFAKTNADSGNPSHDAKPATTFEARSNQGGNAGSGAAPSDTKPEAEKRESTNSQTGPNAGPTPPASKPESGSKPSDASPAPAGAGSAESRSGDKNTDVVSDDTKKPNPSNFDEAANPASTVGDLRSKLDKTEYEKFVKEQQTENTLFDAKQSTDVQTAIAQYEQTLKTNPNDEHAYVELALTYLAKGDMKNAEALAKQLDAKAPESHLSLLLQAELAENHGNLNDQQVFLKKAVEKNPTSAIAQFKLGTALAAAGNDNEATTRLLTAAALNPKNGKVFDELNKVFAKTNTTDLKTFVNGIVPQFELKPFIENGVTLMPVRAISEALGANVGWDGASGQVSIQRGNTTIQLTIGSKTAIVNGQAIEIEVPAKITNGSTVLPLRFVSETLGAQVDWKGESQMIVISE